MSARKLTTFISRWAKIAVREQHRLPRATQKPAFELSEETEIDIAELQRLHQLHKMAQQSSEFVRLCSEAGLKPQISFIGGGNMAQALIKGFVKSGLITVENIGVSDIFPQALEAYKPMKIATSTKNREILKEFGSGLVFLAVKPNTLDQVMSDCGSELSNKAGLFVSILAGTTIDTISTKLATNDRSLPVVRVMPNTGAIVGSAASVFARDSNCTDAHATLVHTLMKTVGTCHEVPEYQIDAVCGLSGSGPAYAYTFIDAMSDGGVKMGLPRDLATQLAAQTVLGAAQMVLETQKHPGDLKNMVCSPGGTTIAGVHVLESAGLRGIVMSAVEAAVKKANELGEQK